jgi:hypothetical protein
MTRKQIVVLLVFVALIGGAWIYLQKKNQAEWAESAVPTGGKLLDFPVNDVTRIEIQGPKDKIDLARKEDFWTVEQKDDYPANFEKVSGFIRQLWEAKPVQEFKVGPTQYERLELLDPDKGEHAGTLVELKDKDGKQLARLIAGKKVMQKRDDMPAGFPGFPTAQYVLAPKSGRVGLVSKVLPADTSPNNWVRRDFIKVDNPSSITLNGQNASKRWKLVRPDAKADWKLADAKPNEELSRDTVTNLTNVLASPSFADVLPRDAKPQEHGLDKPEVLTIETFDRFTYTIQIGKLSGENYPITVQVKERTPEPEEKSEDKTKLDDEFKEKLKKLEEKAAAEKQLDKRIYLLSKYTVESVLKDRSDLIAKPATPTPAATSTGSPSPRKKR